MRGDVFAIKAPRDARGHDQQGRRYAVQVQSDDLVLSTLLVAPTSTPARPTSFRPAVEIDGRRTLVLVEQTTAVDPSRLGRGVGRLSRADLDALDDAFRMVLAMD